jgi:biotin operon repressor
MSGIVRDPEKVPAGTARLECVHCKKQHPITNIAELGDPLRCSECDEVGLVPRRHDRIADKYPGKLGERFATIPLALLDSDNGLNLTPAELLVVIVLNAFRWRGDDLVYPSQERIASMTGLSRRTVQRALDRLAADGLIVVWNERHGSFPRNLYEIAPLLDALAFGRRRPLPLL